MSELILKGDKLATQKKIKLVTIAIISVSMATNIQARLIEPTITTTIVSQTPRQIPSAPVLFSTTGEDYILSFDSIRYSSISRQQNNRDGITPRAFKAFDNELNENWSLFELCLYGPTTYVSRPLQAKIVSNEDLLYIPFTEAYLWENRFEFIQVDTDALLDFERDLRYDWEAFCITDIIPKSIQSLLYDTIFLGPELNGLYEWEYVSWPFCYANDLIYDLSTFLEDADRFVVIRRPNGNISPVAVPEPATFVLLSFSTLVLVGKRR